MSWSFYAAGTVPAVRAALARARESYGAPSATNYSRAELDAASVAIGLLVDMNIGAVAVDASGHASYSDGVKTAEVCSVRVAPIQGWVEG